MTVHDEDLDSDDEYLLENLSHCCGRYSVDINYNRPLKGFPLTLNKIDEVDETVLKSPETGRDENGNVVNEVTRKSPHVAWNPKDEVIKREEKRREKPRPKSASSVGEEVKTKKNDKRPRSSCGLPSRIPVKKNENKKNVQRGWSDEDDEIYSYMERSKIRTKSKHKSMENLKEQDMRHMEAEYPKRPSSACSMRPQSQQPKAMTKRSNSQPNMSRQQNPQLLWNDICRFRRSLRLLGLSSRDFGLPESPKMECLPHRPRSAHGGSPTFKTRLQQRSYSLECLKEAVRDAAKDTLGIGLAQRQLLAQAAYEEWYFKKSEEIESKIQEDKIKTEKLKERLEEETRQREERAGEKFQVWMDDKRKQISARKNKENKLQATMSGKVKKSKAEIDKAYLVWKKKKDEDLMRKKQKQQEEADKAERQKAEREEKKKMADKAFNEWKLKLQEAERIKKAKEKEIKDKLKEQLTERSKSSVSFQTWKDQKENQLMEKWKKERESLKHQEEIQLLIDRMNEAGQAYEDWLDRVDNRKKDEKVARMFLPWAPR